MDEEVAFPPSPDGGAVDDQPAEQEQASPQTQVQDQEQASPQTQPQDAGQQQQQQQEEVVVEEEARAVDSPPAGGDITAEGGAGGEGEEPPEDWLQPLEDDDCDEGDEEEEEGERLSWGQAGSREGSVSGSLVGGGGGGGGGGGERSTRGGRGGGGGGRGGRKRRSIHSLLDEGGWDDCPDLGEGWKRKEVLRRSGVQAGKSDVYYISPQGVRVRSKVELAKCVPSSTDMHMFDYKAGVFVSEFSGRKMRKMQREYGRSKLRSPDDGNEQQQQEVQQQEQQEQQEVLALGRGKRKRKRKLMQLQQEVVAEENRKRKRKQEVLEGERARKRAKNFSDADKSRLRQLVLSAPQAQDRRRSVRSAVWAEIRQSFNSQTETSRTTQQLQSRKDEEVRSVDFSDDSSHLAEDRFSRTPDSGQPITGHLDIGLAPLSPASSMETPPRKAHPSPKKPGICMKCSRSFNATTGHRLCLICREQEKPKRDIQFRKWVPCGKCKACMTTVDCGACAGCRKAEGNPGKTVRCRKRKCLCPIRKTPFRHEVEQASLAFSVDVLTDYRVSGSSLVRRPGDRKKTLPSQGSDSDEYRPPYEDTDEDEEEEGEQEEEEEEEEEEGEDEDGEALRRKRRTCGKCKGCVLQRDCGTCDFCFDKPKFGGSNKKRQKCRLRQCTRQAMRHLLPGEGKKGRGRRREPWEFEFSDNEGDGRSGSRPVKVQKTYSRQLQTTVQPLQPLTPIMVNAPILNTQQVVAVSGVSIRQNSSTSQILTTALPIAGRPVATVWAPLVVQSHQRAPEPQTQVQPQPQPPPQVQVQVLAQPPPQPLPQRQVLAQVQPQPQPQPQRQTQVLVQTPPQRQPQLLVQTQTQRPPQPQAVTESRVARSWSSAAAMETANDSRVGRSWNSATMETANGSSRHSVEETQLSNGDAGGGVEEEEDGVPTITGIFSLAGAGGRGVELDSELMSLLDGVRGECLPALWLCVLGAGSGSGPELRLLQCSKTSTMSDTCVTIGNGLNYYSIHVQQHPLVPTHPLYTQHGARMSTPQQVVALLRDLEGHAVCQGIRSAPPPNEPFISVRAATCLFLIPRSRTRCGECRYPSENK